MKPIHFESFRLGFFFIFFSLFFILFLHLFLTVCQFSDLLTLIHFLNFFSYQTNFQILNAYFFLFFFHSQVNFLGFLYPFSFLLPSTFRVHISKFPLIRIDPVFQNIWSFLERYLYGIKKISFDFTWRR